MPIKAETLEAHVKVTGTAKAKRDLDSLNDSAAQIGTTFTASGKQADAGAKRVDNAGARMSAAMKGGAKAAKDQARETARAAAGAKDLGDEARAAADGLGGMGGGLRRTQNDADGAGRSIDKLSGRLRIIADLIAILGPAGVPVLASLVPVASALAASFGATAVGAGVLIGSMQGVGDALKAVNKAGLEPTEANLENARLAMSQLSPEARKFVRELHSMGGPLKDLRDLGATNMLPGFTEGLESARTLLPEGRRLVRNYAAEIGRLGAETGESLASNRWRPFLRFLADEGPAAMRSTVKSAGNLAHAAAEMWMAFNPTNQTALDAFEGWTERLDKAASRMKDTEGFREFVDYLNTTGPQVGAMIGAWANAFLQVAEAAAPIGGVVLQGLTAVAKVVAAVADSDLGTPILAGVAALALYNRALATASALSKSTFISGPVGNMQRQGKAIRGLTQDFSAWNRVRNAPASARPLFPASTITQANRFRSTLKSTAAQAGKTGAAIAGMAVVMTGTADKMGLTNTASLALIGSMGGPWGAAFGAAIGATIDLAHSNDDLESSIKAANQAMETRNVAAMRTEYERLGKQIKDNNSTPWWQPIDFKRAWNGLTGTANKAEETRKRLKAMMDPNGPRTFGQAIGDMGTRLAGQMTRGAAATRRQSEALRAARQAAAETARQFVNVGNAAESAGGNLNRFIRTLQRQAADLQAFASNAQIAANRGLRQGLIKQLQALGPAGATMMRKFATASDAQIARANRAFAKGRQAILDYALATGKVPPAKGTKVTTEGAEVAQAKIRLFRGEIERLKDKRVHMGEKGAAEATRKIRQLQQAINALRGRTVTNRIITYRETRGANAGASGNVGQGQAPDAFARGGYTGDGGKYEPAGTVHRGEFVMDKETTSRVRPMLEAIHATRGAVLGALGSYARGGGVKTNPTRARGNAIVNNLAENIKKGAIAGIERAAQVMERRMSGGAERAWEKRFKKVLGASERLAKANLDLAATVAKRDALIQSRDSARQAITEGITSQANVLNAGNSASAIRASLETQLGKAREFARNLQELRSAGYSNAILEQVASAGIEGGAEIAKALLAGSSEDRAAINAAFKGITDVGAATGKQLSGQMYDSGIQAANGIIAGLKARKKQIESYLTQVAQGMERALKKALKIKSPSQVTAQIGSYVGQGLVKGLERQNKPTLQASRNLARSAIRGFGDLGPAGGLAGPQIGTRALTPGSLGVAPSQGNLTLEFKTYNPVAEPQSRTTNKALDRVAALGLVPG